MSVGGVCVCEQVSEHRSLLGSDLRPLSTLLSSGPLLAANASLVVHHLWLESSRGHFLGDAGCSQVCIKPGPDKSSLENSAP